MAEDNHADDNPVQHCTGENTCLRHFEYKTSIGRCHKCVLLANNAPTEHPRIPGIPQCQPHCNVTPDDGLPHCNMGTVATFILEPFVGTKPCMYLSTFEVIREGTIKFCEIVDNGITSFNSSWEQDSEESLTRMNNVHIEVEPQALFKDVLQTVLKDSSQLLNKTAPNKFRNRKFPTVYIEAHIELAKFEDRTGVSPPRALFKVPKRARTDTLSSSQGGSVLKSNTVRSLKSSFALHAPATNATAVTHLANGGHNIKRGHDYNIPSSKSKSKFVFKVIYNELPYVAKHCYTLGNGTPVSIIANRNELINKATTLRRAKFFLANFKDEYFEVTDFIIAHESVHCVPEETDKSSFAPSLASGIKVSEYKTLTDGEKDKLVINDDLVSSVTWLLECE
ncbi:hypothetical protein DFH08DRAFT_802105 [Mycena albidolilacea]|uniref:Uncharacterized protein n=1 Tax=Mycena albidolilacea TaxID=1033008 RepID=A0AAD7AGR9_9AGAR|nr:hypothetical protein DFH08DRAFT_802105 [Mycena albidolilacea]